MRREELAEILEEWNFWKKDLNTGRERKEYVDKCLRLIGNNTVTAITGVRRSGKSYIMRQAIKRLIESGTERKNVLMVNFEDKRFPEFHAKLLDEAYSAYLELLAPDAKPYVFLDEVHNVPNWERWVRTMHELEKAIIIVSGSSSKLLSGELATLLTGRHLDLNVFPLSFREFLLFKDIEVKGALDLAAKRVGIRRSLGEYLESGGFPGVALGAEKKQLLLTYFDDILTKDIEKRYKVRKRETLRALARFYMTSISSTITFSSLAKHLGTTTVTIEKFSSHLEEAGLVFFLKRFSFKAREQEKSPRKAYSIDTGLANAVGFRFSQDSGRVAENAVAIELRRKCALDPNLEAYYWKNPQHEEVDFVIKEGPKVRQLIQVCWDVGGYGTKEREVRALLKAGRELKCSNLLVITEDYEAEERVKGKKITYKPIGKWLLGF